MKNKGGGLAAKRREAAARKAEERLSEVSADALAAKVGERVVGQEGAVEATCRFLVAALARAAKLCRGVDEGELPHLDALLLDGPSGCGKTYMVRLACRELGIGMVEVDGSTLTGTGWRGGDVEDVKYRLAEAQERPEDCSVTVVFVDEADKLAKDGKEPSFSPCANLLKLIEGSEITDVEGKRRLELDKAMLIFVLAGAFEGLDRIVRARIAGKGGVGFCGGELASALNAAELRARAVPADLVAWGLPRELVGRVTTLARLRPLVAEDMRRVAKGGEGSAEARWSALMPFGCSLELSDGAARAAAENAIEEGRGARGVEAALGPVCLEALEEARADDGIVGVHVVSRDGDLAVEYERGERPAPKQEPESEDADEVVDAAEEEETKDEGADGWEAPRWVGSADARSDLAHMAVAAGADPVRALKSAGAHDIADALVDGLMKDLEPARARLANELVYGCLKLIEDYGDASEASAATLAGLLREVSTGKLLERARGIFDGRLASRKRRALGVATMRTGNVAHYGVGPGWDSALRHIACFLAIAGGDAAGIAEEAADAVGALAARE